MNQNQSIEYNEVIQFLKEYNEVIQFLKENTQFFDESHDYNHAIAVYNNAIEIINHCNLEYYDYRIIMFASLLHDVCDHKYVNAIKMETLRNFIRKYFDEYLTDVIICIIDNISFSKQSKQKNIIDYNLPENIDLKNIDLKNIDASKSKLPDSYNIYLDVISDADKLEALGKKGIERCETYVRAKNGKIPEDVINHCHEKLLKLYPENYIKTDYGRKLAEPLHLEIVEYVENKSVKLVKIDNL